MTSEDELVARLVAAAPALSPEQAQRLTVLLSAPINSTRRASTQQAPKASDAA